jgi:hypothetical protein
MGFVAVVLLLVRFARVQPLDADSGVLRTAPPTISPARHRSEFVMFTAGLGWASCVLVFLSAWNIFSYLDSTDIAAAYATAERHLHASLLYALVVFVPAQLTLALANWRWRRATPQPLHCSRVTGGLASPILGDAYRGLGRTAALALIALGASCAGLAWIIARHYGA